MARPVMPPPGSLARVSAFVLVAVVIVMSHGWQLVLAGVVSLSAASRLHPRGFAVVRRLSLWVFLVTLALPPVLWTEPRDLTTPVGVDLSSAGVILATSMCARAVVLAIAATGLVSTVSAHELAALFEWLGLRGLGFALGVALHAWPEMAERWPTAIQLFRLRGGFRRHRIRHVLLLTTSVLGAALRHADSVVEAAHARAFAPGRYAPVAPPAWRTDLVWMTGWTLGAVVILTLGS